MSDLLLSPCCEPGWFLIEEGIDPAREHEIELILAIANGYLGVRALDCRRPQIFSSIDLYRRHLRTVRRSDCFP